MSDTQAAPGLVLVDTQAGPGVVLDTAGDYLDTASVDILPVVAGTDIQAAVEGRLCAAGDSLLFQAETDKPQSLAVPLARWQVGARALWSAAF